MSDYQIARVIGPILALLLSGCTVIGPNQTAPADWPELRVQVEKVGFWDTQRLCGGNLLIPIAACAFVNFDHMACVIVTATDDANVMEHEYARCKGRDHIGSTRFRDGWARWKRTGKHQ